MLIGADGAGSLVRKELHGHRQTRAPHPLRLFRAEIPQPAAAGIREARSAAADREARSAAAGIRFGGPEAPMVYDFTPMVDGLRGYLWLFPVPGGRLNVGVMHAPAPPRRRAAGPR